MLICVVHGFTTTEAQPQLLRRKNVPQASKPRQIMWPIGGPISRLADLADEVAPRLCHQITKIISNFVAMAISVGSACGWPEGAVSTSCWRWRAPRLRRPNLAVPS